MMHGTLEKRTLPERVVALFAWQCVDEQIADPNCSDEEVIGGWMYLKTEFRLTLLEETPWN